MSTTVDLGKITASVTVGTTTTGAAGTNASVSNSGTTQDAVLNFTIPRGAQGVQGPQGSTGPQGPAGPTGPQGPMGDVAVITPEQQSAFTMYSVPGQNTDGPMTQKAVTDNFAEIGNDLNNGDLEFADPLGNVLASFENGGLKTKNFDSSTDTPTRGNNSQYGDLEIADPEGNVLVSFENGGIKTKKFNSDDIAGNPWKGKKVVWDGHSAVYGSLLNRDETFPYIVSNMLGMSFINYAIGGSTVCRREGDYDGVYLSYSEWTAAISGGLLDTSKKYLVKDGVTGDARPFGIYYYSNGNWIKQGTSSEQCGRTPLVSRIQQLDTTADLVVIGIGENDWAYLWGELGSFNDESEFTIIGAMKKVCQWLADNFQRKNVMFISVCPAWRYQPIGLSMATWNMIDPFAISPLNYSWNQVRDAIKMVANIYGFPYFDLTEECNLSPTETWWVADSDGKRVHLNAEATRIVSYIIANKIISLKL